MGFLKCLEACVSIQFEVGEKISPVIMINQHYNNHTRTLYNYADWDRLVTANKPLIAKYKISGYLVRKT